MTNTNTKSGIFIRYFFLVFLLFIFFPFAFYFIPTPGLDHSWEIAIHLAWKGHLIFGKDFIFPYGPLAILVTRLPIAVNKYVYLLFDLYFLATLFFVLRNIFRKHFGVGVVLFIFLALIVTSYPLPDQSCFVFFLFYLFAFIKDPARYGYLWQAALLSLIGLFIKISTGSVEVMIFLLAFTYLFFRRKIDLIFYVAILMGYAFCMLAAARILHVDLIGYIRSGLHLIGDYGDAMFSPLSGDTLISIGHGAWVIILIIFAWLLYTLIHIIREKAFLKKMDDVFIHVMIALSIFVLFKASFVRAAYHTFSFFEYITLFVSLLYLYRPEGLSKKVSVAGCFAVLVVSIWGVYILAGGLVYQRVVKLSFASDKFRDVGNYFRQLLHYDQELTDREKPDLSKNELKERIGAHTVDVFPAEISKIYFNGLVYDPRPVIQSYVAFDEYLDNLNYDKYMSDGAPDYILFSVGSIDDRYSFFDESMTKLAILRNYTIAGKIGSDLLLEKRSVPLGMPAAEREETLHAKFGENIQVGKTNDIQFSRIYVKYSLWGRIRSFFFQPPALKISIVPEGGGGQTFRAVKPILAGGVISNKYVDSDGEFLLFMQSGGRMNTDIKKITFESESGNAAGFVNDIRIVNAFYPFSTLIEKSTAPDSLKLASVLADYKPVPVDPSLYAKDSFRAGIETYRPDAPFFSLGGWAFREGGDNGHNILKVVLKSADKMYELPTLSLGRPDLITYFKRGDLGNVGFSSSLDKSLLPPANYKVGLSILNPETKKRWVSYLGLDLQIRTEATVEKIAPADMVSIGESVALGNVDTVRNQDDQFIVDGWASVNAIDPVKMTTNIILKGKGMGYRVSTERSTRKDVAGFQKNPLLENSGFSTRIPVNKIAKGSYLIGIENIYMGGKGRSVTFSTRKINL